MQRHTEIVIPSRRTALERSVKTLLCVGGVGCGGGGGGGGGGKGERDLKSILRGPRH